MLDERAEAVPTPLSSSNQTPDWSQITHDVFCPLCEYNLRGIREPRCPECGYPFAWPDILSPHRMDHPYLFEHHPNRNVWSYCQTARGIWLPLRFWKLLHPWQRSRFNRLILFWFIGLVPLLFANSGLFVSSIVTIVREINARRAEVKSRIIAQQSDHSTRMSIANYGSIEKYLDSLAPSATFGGVLTSWINSGQRPVAMLINQLAVPLLWPWSTFIALSIFQWSMRMARIKSIHVLRCVLYSFDLTLWAWLIFAAALIAPLGTLGFPSWDAFLLAIRDTGILIGTYRLVVAYHKYLRFTHPVLAVVSSQLITVLLMFALIYLYWPNRIVGEFMTDPITRCIVSSGL